MKKMLKRLSLFSIALVVLTGSLLVGTMAKYTSTYEGVGQVSVAKWSFEIGEETEVENKDFQVTLTPNEGYTNVANGKAAPGTAGKFEIVIENTGDVDAEIKVEFSTDTTQMPALKFAYSGDTTADEDGNFSPADGIELKGSSYVYMFKPTGSDSRTSETLTLNMAGGTKSTETIIVYWYWDFTGTAGDEVDTGFGETGGNLSIVDIKITATQAKPTKAAA